jgi:hypothetical protein
VGFLRRRSNLETELAALTTRKDLLTRQLATAEQRLDEAVAARKVHLLEGDPDVPIGETPIIERLRDEKAATLDALTAIGQRIIEAEAKLATERDLAMRSAAAKELSSAADALAAVAADLAGVVARIPAALADVLSRLPAPHAVAPERIKTFADGLVEALQTEAGEARAYIVRLGSGDAALVTPRPDDVKTAAPAPIVERREVFILAPSKWVEPSGEVITVGTHCTASPPVEIAKLALQHGHALEAGSPLAVTLQMRQPPNYASFAPADCTDISRPKELIKPLGTPTAASPPIHSEFVGQPRVGTARVARI